MAESLFQYKEEVNHASSLHGTLSSGGGGGRTLSATIRMNIIREAIWFIRQEALVSLHSIFPKWDLMQT